MSDITREQIEALLVEATPGPWASDIQHSEYIWGPSMEMIADTDDDAGPHVLRIRGTGAQLPQKANIELAAAAPALARQLLATMDERDAALAREAALRSALDAVEWTPDLLLRGRWCPACGNPEHDGHNDDCTTAEALVKP